MRPLRSPRLPETYLLLGLVFGVLWFAVIGGLYVAGLFGQLVLLSFPNIVWAQLLLRPIGRFERFLVISMLGQDVPAPEPLRYARSTGSWWSGLVNVLRRSYAVFQDGHSWRVLVWVLVRVVIGPLGFLLVVLPVLLVLAPLVVLVDAVSDGVSIDFAGKYWLLLGPVGLVVLPALRTGDARSGRRAPDGSRCGRSGPVAARSRRPPSPAPPRRRNRYASTRSCTTASATCCR